MGIESSLLKRRSVYGLGKNLPVQPDRVIEAVTQAVALVPDAFNMRSQRAAIVLGERHDALWDLVYDTFGGKVAREKIDGFKAAAGTVLYFTDEPTVKAMQEKYSIYADNFPVWAQQSNGMLQLAVWASLRDLGVGANIQHYNPVIDAAVRELLSLPKEWRLVAQMPFGEILAEPDAKEGEDVSARVRVL